MPGTTEFRVFFPYDMYIMNKILIIIILSICTVSYAQQPETVHHFGSIATAYGRQIIAGGNNIWLTGEFSGELISNTETGLMSELPAIFAARYSAQGIRECLIRIENESQVKSAVSDETGVLWLLTGNDGNEKLYSVSPEGVVSSPVLFEKSTDFIIQDFILFNQTVYLCGDSEEKCFLAAYTLSGKQLWYSAEEGYLSASGKKIETDGTDIILAGTYQGTATNNTDIFVSRFNTSGEKKWTCPITGAGNETISDIACLSDGKLILSGSTTSQQLSIGSSTQTTTSTGTQHALCIMLNPDGSYSSIYTAGGTSTGKNTAINTLYVNDNDEIYAGGYCMGKVIFNPSGDNRYNLPDKGAKDAFIVKLSSENQVLNVKRFGNKTDEEITDLLFIPDAKEYRLFTLTNFKEANEYGTIYNTTNLTLSGTATFPLETIGSGNNVVLASYAHIRIFTNHVIPAQEGVSYHNCVYHRGGSRKVTYQLLSGDLPSGMHFSSQGDLSGTPSESGSFPLAIRGTDELGDSSDSACILQVESNGGVGWAEAEESRFQVYPNPVEDKFFIKGLTGKVRLQVISTQGQLMVDHILQDTSEAIHISHFPQGVYIIKCISEQSILSKKIIKK